MFTLDQGTFLVKHARLAIESHLSKGAGPEPVWEYRGPQPQSGVFVTLLNASNAMALRGCVGAPFLHRPLLAQLSQVAVEAATMDPRFSRVSLTEMKNRLVVEVTVLTRPEVVEVRRPLDYLESVRVGIDGLIVEAMGFKSLLLPQVAIDEKFDSEEFLSECCLKAGLLPDTWLSGQVQVSRFQGQVFLEEKPGGRVFQRSLKTQLQSE